MFTTRIIGHWNRLPVSSSLELLKARLDGVLSHLLQWKDSFQKDSCPVAKPDTGVAENQK